MTVAHLDNMPERRGLVLSAVLHLLVVLAVVLGLPSVFQTHIDEDQPLVVEIVNIGPKTLATMKAFKPPTPKAPPKVVQTEQPKPTPPQPQQARTAPPPPPMPKPADVQVPEKQQPPKPEVRPQPPQPPQPLPPQKKQNMAFDTLLKNLASKPLPQDQPAQQSAKPQPSSQPVAPLGAQLSVSELDLVKQQIEQCWELQTAGAPDAQNLMPEFHVYMNPDGTVRSATLMNPERLSDPFFQAAAESAHRALLNPRCQPLKLPPQKYDLWQTFTITFDPKDLS